MRWRIILKFHHMSIQDFNKKSREEMRQQLDRLIKVKEQAVETEQEKEIYVFGLWECFGEWSICGVYTSKLKLIEDYRRIMTGNVRCHPFSDDPREPVIYRFHANEFIGEMPEWNDNKLFMEETEISIQEVQEKVEIYNDGGFQVFCNFNFEGDHKIQVRYIGGMEDDITDADVFLDMDTIEGEFSNEYVHYILPLLKEWYNDNKEILRQIWETKQYIPIPDWMECG